MSIGRLSIGETVKEVVNRSIIELQERLDGEGTSSFRVALTANRTYYVLTTGSDNNTGRANTAAGAFLTIQKAINVVSTLDLAGFAVTIQVGAGTYTAGVSVTRPFLGGNVTLLGDSTTPANVIISVASGNAINVSIGALTVSGFQIAAAAGSGIGVDSGARVNVVGGVRFGACNAWVAAQINGYIQLAGATITAVGDAVVGLYGLAAGAIDLIGGTFVASGARTLSFFAYAEDGGLIRSQQTVFGGTFTGTRFFSQSNAVIVVFNLGANYFPGTAAGYTTNGGTYR